MQFLHLFLNRMILGVKSVHMLEKKKGLVLGERSGEYGGWNKISYFKSEVFCCVILATCSQALPLNKIMTKLEPT